MKDFDLRHQLDAVFSFVDDFHTKLVENYSLNCGLFKEGNWHQLFNVKVVHEGVRFSVDITRTYFNKSIYCKLQDLELNDGYLEFTVSKEDYNYVLQTWYKDIINCDAV